jgi:hypothetical protein
MKRILKISTLLSALILMGIMLILVGACGERNLPLKVDNRTDMTLTIFVQEHEVGTVKPNSIVSIKGIPGTLTYYLIEAKNSKGELVYSKMFSVSELHDANWNVTLTPS